MRHLFGFVLGVVLAAVASVALVFGLGEVAAREGRVSTTGLVLVCAAGVLFGLLAALRRTSPLAPLVGGLLLLAAGIAAWVRPGLSTDVAHRSGPAAGRPPVALQLGIALLLGSLLVVVGLLPGGRRRDREVRVDRDDRDDDGYTPLPRSEPEAWRSQTGSGTNAYPTATPYQRPPLDRPQP